MQNKSSVALPYFQDAASCYQQARYVESIQNYLLGLEYDASHYHIYADLAKAYEMVGNWELALLNLDIALRLCPNSSTIKRRKSRITEEKIFYQSIIDDLDLVSERPSDFVPDLLSDGLLRPQFKIGTDSYKLTVDPVIDLLVFWLICQLIEHTYNRVGNLLDRYPDEQIDITITNTYGAQIQSDVPNWVSGVYDGKIRIFYCAEEEPELGVIYTLLRHEWTHLLIDLITKGNCPTWLNEGLAQTLSRPLMSFEKRYLEQADKNNTLPTLSELNSPFSDLSSSDRKIAYLQSAAIVAELINKTGYKSIQTLLQQLGNRVPIEDAFEHTFGEIGIIK
ncbi:hypothetical protein JT359_02650 [Candidatus Poribacteria bacterium]|nr:hypothetical protein [Candidatus Poribacteria bacterium]